MYDIYPIIVYKESDPTQPNLEINNEQELRNHLKDQLQKHKGNTLRVISININKGIYELPMYITKNKLVDAITIIMREMI